VGSLFGRRFEGYKLTSPPSLLDIPICNIFSHNNKSGLFQLCSEIRLNWLNSINNFLVCFFLFIFFIIPLYLFNIIFRVALLVFCFSGKITHFSQQVVSRAEGSPLGCLKLFVILILYFEFVMARGRQQSQTKGRRGRSKSKGRVIAKDECAFCHEKGH